MNKNILILALLILFQTKGFCQVTEPSGTSVNSVNSNALKSLNVASPNVTSFQKVNHIPTNEYTGRAELNIPLYEITSGDITIPISISYNSSGVKVNDIPSSVGSNWALNAGGNVSKIVKDKEDFYFFAEFEEGYNSAVPDLNNLGDYGVRGLVGNLSQNLILPVTVAQFYK